MFAPSPRKIQLLIVIKITVRIIPNRGQDQEKVALSCLRGYPYLERRRSRPRRGKQISENWYPKQGVVGKKRLPSFEVAAYIFPAALMPSLLLLLLLAFLAQQFLKFSQATPVLLALGRPSITGRHCLLSLSFWTTTYKLHISSETKEEREKRRKRKRGD